MKGGGQPDSRPRWTIDDVFEALRDVAGDDAVAAIRRLHDSVLSMDGRVYPGKGSYPTCSMYVQLDGTPKSICAVYADPSGGSGPRITLNLYPFRQVLGDEAFERVVGALRTCPDLVAPLAHVSAGEKHEYPTVPIAVLATPGVAESIVDAWRTQVS